MESNHGVLRLPCPCPQHFFGPGPLVINQVDRLSVAVGWLRPGAYVPAEVTQRRFYSECGFTPAHGEVYFWREDA